MIISCKKKYISSFFYQYRFFTTSKPKYAIFSLNTPTSLNDNDYFSLILKLLHSSSHNQHWEYFNLLDNQFPPLNKILSYDGYILTGYDDFQKIPNFSFDEKLKNIILQLYSLKKKILCISLGHIFLTQALGGTFIMSKHSDNGVKQIFFNKFFTRFYKALFHIPSPTIRVCQCHDLIVNKLPPLRNTVLLASSLYTPVEMYSISNQIFSLQFHPEFDRHLLKKQLILKEKDEKLNKTSYHMALNSISEFDHDATIIERICYYFFFNQLLPIQSPLNYGTIYNEP